MIPSTPDEDLLYKLLKELAARLSHALTEDGVRHGFIGGTALKIGYGLTRPSTDLDVKVEEPRFFTQYIERAFDAVTEWSYREPTDEEWNRGAEGLIVEHLATGQTFSTRVDFVPGPLHDTDSPTIDDRQLEEHHGVRMFGLADLAQYKLNALIGPAPRKRPRDVYDAAWLMENWPDAIEAATKRKLYQWHRSLSTSPALFAEWTNEFQTPDVGRHVTLETLMGCLAASFEVSAPRTPAGEPIGDAGVPDDDLPRHKDDFGRVYDLEDPGPYFNALRPSGYRMPEVLAGALKAIHRSVCAARDAGDTLRVLDFACGYGAVGALLRHRISMRELYARYAHRQWQSGDGRTNWEADAEFFAVRRVGSRGFEIGGTDIARAALEYAEAMGFVDRIFPANLVDHPPSEALGRFLRGVDLVVESGSLGELLPAAFERILDWSGDRPPWFLYGPRPDTDWTGLDRLWAAKGYRSESLGAEPVRYRKPLGAPEHADFLRATRALGKADESVMRDGFLLVDMTLARPEAEAGNPPVGQLRASYD